MSSIILYRQEIHYIDWQYNTHNRYTLKIIFEKTTVAGFEPTHPEDNWFQVNRLRPLGHTVLIFYLLFTLLFPVFLHMYILFYCYFFLIYPFSLYHLYYYFFFSFFFSFFSLSYVPSFSFYSVISNSIVGPVSSPVTWKTGVRIPVGEFFWNFYFFLSYYSHASCGLYFLLTYYCLGGVAHMVEHSLCMRGARGSIPRISIFIFIFYLCFLFYIFYIFILFYFLFTILCFFIQKFKKRQRQGSNLRSQREIA